MRLQQPLTFTSNTLEYEQAYNLIGGNWKVALPSLEEFAAGTQIR
jgi:hypothetical protein